jgi:hypothetical protein
MDGVVVLVARVVFHEMIVECQKYFGGKPFGDRPEGKATKI